MTHEQSTEILRANFHDLAELTPLFEQYRSFYGRPSSQEATLTFLKARMEAEESVIFIARCLGELIGFAQLYPSFSSLSLKPSWTLNDLFVLPHTRGRGVGRLLLSKVEQFAKETGAINVTLKTAKDNLAAQGLYEQHGWIRDNQFYSYDRKLDGEK